MAQLLASLAIEQEQQVIVTTHSPLFCQKILSIQRDHPKKVALLVMRQEGGETRCQRFPQGPLFEDQEVRKALTRQKEDGWFEGLFSGGLSMANLLNVDLFAEDMAHEAFLDALIRRLFGEADMKTVIRHRSPLGGHGKMLTELEVFQKIIQGADNPESMCPTS